MRFNLNKVAYILVAAFKTSGGHRTFRTISSGTLLMVANSLTARWLRSILGLLALAGFAMLGGCGGGSGAPNNPFAPPPPTPTPVVILPGTATAYSNTPTVLTVEGGVPPYFIVSSDSSILPVVQSATAGTVVLLPSNVVSDTQVTITAQDSIGQIGTATVTVKAAPIFNALTVTPNSAACGVNAVCSGQTATAAVKVTGPGGAGIPNRQVKFDVVTGAFSIQSNDPAHPLVQTLTVVSDVTGVAQVLLQAAAGVVTQPALLRATDITSGNQQTAQFTIVQTINGQGVLSIVPPSVTFTGATTLDCPINFRADFYIFGGKPPYNVAVTPSVPIELILANVPVTTQGGFFTVITTGQCANPTLTLVITDAQQLQTTATVTVQFGTTAPPPPTPPAALVISLSVSSHKCDGTFAFPYVVAGGTPSYNVGSALGAAVTQPNAFGIGSVTPPVLAAGTLVPVVVVDSGSPQQTASTTITCTS